MKMENVTNLIFTIIIILFLVSSFVILSFGFISHTETIQRLIGNEKLQNGEIVRKELNSEDNSVIIDIVYFIPDNLKVGDTIKIKIINIEKLNNEKEKEE